MMDEIVIFDAGSRTLRLGKGSDVSPSCFKTRIVRRWNTGMVFGMPSQYSFGRKGDATVGNYGGSYGAFNPYDGATMNNFDYLLEIWKNAFYSEDRFTSAEYLILTEPVLNTKAARERMVELAFDTFQFYAVYIKSRPVLSIIGAGRSTGCVLRVGGSVTSVVPIIEGQIIPHAIQFSSINGKFLDDQLKFSLRNAGYLFRDIEHDHILPHIREQVLFVAPSAAKSKIPTEVNFTLTDGQLYTLGYPGQLYEVLFSPTTTGQALHEIVEGCLNSLSTKVRSVVEKNFILTGRVTNTKGFVKRLQSEIKMHLPYAAIVVSKYRSHLAWLGAKAVATSFDLLNSLSLKREEYDEVGPSIAKAFE